MRPDGSIWRAAGSAKLDLSYDRRDSAPGMPKAVVCEQAMEWGDDRAPNVPWAKTVIYEAHVKGLTALHPGVPAPLRGTVLGLCADPVLEHLVKLGVTRQVVDETLAVIDSLAVCDILPLDDMLRDDDSVAD